MTPEDEQLMAYVDGELDPMARSQFERALAADPALVRRVAAQRELRSRLASSLDPQLAEPVPERLLQIARTAPAGKAPVVALSAWRARARAEPRAARPRGWPAALAASWLLAGVLGVALWRAPGAGGLSLRNGQLVVRGPVASALSGSLVSAQPANPAVRIGLSFRDHAGRLCRTFMVQAQSSAGIACRAGPDWLVEGVAAAPAEAGGADRLRMAGSAWPASIMREVEQRIDGEALDAAGEQRARAQDWRP